MTRPIDTLAQRAAAKGITLAELLVVIALIGMLTTVSVSGAAWFRQRAGMAVSTTHLHALVAANAGYAVDHDGSSCPATSADNLTRWHGGRRSLNDEFDPLHGFLTPYFGGHRQSLTCPLLRTKDASSFEQGAGGYGYNAQYFGSTPQNPFVGALIAELPDAGHAVMFATTALAVAGGIQEYPFTEPYEWIDRRGRLRGPLQPSTHFRAAGKALIAWCDGSVTAELPNQESGPNFYNGDNRNARIGWFGPREHNGFWNPGSPSALGHQP